MASISHPQAPASGWIRTHLQSGYQTTEGGVSARVIVGTIVIVGVYLPIAIFLWITLIAFVHDMFWPEEK